MAWGVPPLEEKEERLVFEAVERYGRKMERMITWS
jgi:hypothetical protein